MSPIESIGQSWIPPVWTTATRPTGADSAFGINRDTDMIEYYDSDDGVWRAVEAGGNPEAWTTLTLNSNWSTGTGGQTPAYRIDRGRAYMRGSVMRGSAGTNLLAPFATLPSRARPTQTGGVVNVMLNFGGTINNLNVTTGGVVSIGNATNSFPIYLDGISWPLD